MLGSALKRELRQRGHTVFGCDLRHSDDPQEMRADVADYRQLSVAFATASPDTVFHLAGEFGRINGVNFAEQLWRTNCLGTHNVIDQCLCYQSRLVFASSSEAYGDLADAGSLTESMLADRVPKFHNEYALTKWVGEKQIEIARERSGLRAMSLRFFNVYGPGEFFSPYRSVVCKFAYSLLHNQPIKVHYGLRDFLYICDWSNTVANIADKFDRITGYAYNVCGSSVYSIQELSHIVAEACGISTDSDLIGLCESEPNNVVRKFPYMGLAKQDLDHDPRVNIHEGVKMTVDWMREVYAKR